MLNMGFKESVQSILAAAKGVEDLQTMLFSATKPSWVKSLEDSFLRKVCTHCLLLPSPVPRPVLPCVSCAYAWFQYSLVIAYAWL